jgi:hypothetical protein
MMSGKTIEERVDESLQEENIIVEVKKDGK